MPTRSAQSAAAFVPVDHPTEADVSTQTPRSACERAGPTSPATAFARTRPLLTLCFAALFCVFRCRVLRGSWSSKKVRAKVQESKTILSEIEQLYILHLQSGPAGEGFGSSSSSSHAAGSSSTGARRGAASRPDMYSQLSSLRLEDIAHLSSQEAEAEDEALRMRSPQPQAASSTDASNNLDSAASFPPPSTPRGGGGSGGGGGSDIFGRLDSSESALGAASSSPQESEDEADEFEDAADDVSSNMRTPRNNGSKPSSARTLFGGPSISTSAVRSRPYSVPSALGLSNHAYGTSLVLIFQLSRLLSTLPLSSAFNPSSWWGSRRAASTDADPRTILHRDLVLLASHQLTPEQKLRWVTQMWRNYEFLKA